MLPLIIACKKEYFLFEESYTYLKESNHVLGPKHLALHYFKTRNSYHCAITTHQLWDYWFSMFFMINVFASLNWKIYEMYVLYTTSQQAMNLKSECLKL